MRRAKVEACLYRLTMSRAYTTLVNRPIRGLFVGAFREKAK